MTIEDLGSVIPARKARLSRDMAVFGWRRSHDRFYWWIDTGYVDVLISGS